jgi:hypothetical protein
MFRGQFVGAAVPAGQNAPAGQMFADAEVEPLGQNQPAVHDPLHWGSESPVIEP